MKQTARLPVRAGLSTLPQPMTRAQALRHAQRTMPADLRRAGFVATVYTTDPEIHGGAWHRIGWAK